MKSMTCRDCKRPYGNDLNAAAQHEEDTGHTVPGLWDENPSAADNDAYRARQHALFNDRRHVK